MTIIQFRFLILFITLIFVSVYADAALFSFSKKNEKLNECESAKEFITTFEYLKTKKSIDSGDIIFAAAKDVSSGCNGAAEKFIVAFETLSKTELTLKEMIQISVEASKKTKEQVKAFLEIFSALYSQDGFDLALDDSIKLAKKLSIDYTGELKDLKDEFSKVSDFCLKESGLNLPKKTCADLAQLITIKTIEFNHAMSDSYIEHFKYLTDKDQVSLTTADAIEINNKLTQISPWAFENFKVAYQYAVATKGLARKKEESLKFALVIAQNSKTVVPSVLEPKK